MIDPNVLFMGGPAPLAQGIEIFKQDRQQAIVNQQNADQLALQQEQNKLAEASQQAQNKRAEALAGRQQTEFDYKLQEFARQRQQDHVLQTTRQVSALIANGDTASALQVLQKSFADAQSIPELGGLADDYAQYGEMLAAGDVATVKNQADAVISAFMPVTAPKAGQQGSSVQIESVDPATEKRYRYFASEIFDPNNSTTRPVYTPITPGAPAMPPGPIEQVQTSTGLTPTALIDQVSAKAEAETTATEAAKRRSDVIETNNKQKTAARETVRKLGPMREALADFNSGRLAVARQKLAKIIPGLSDPDAELSQSLFTQFILGQKDALLGGGILSDSDVALLQSVGPQIGNTPEGNAKILDVFEKGARAVLANASEFDAFVAGGGDPERFAPTDKLSFDATSAASQPTEPATQSLQQPVMATPNSGRSRFDRRKGGGDSVMRRTSSGIQYEILGD